MRRFLFAVPFLLGAIAVVWIAATFLSNPVALTVTLIIAAAYTDPLLGELKPRLPRRQALGGGVVAAFLIYIAIFGIAGELSSAALGYALVAAVVMVAVELPSVKWLDDDLLMQLVPVVVLLLLAALPGTPQLPGDVLTEVLECC